jgi:hypothetical protein
MLVLTRADQPNSLRKPPDEARLAPAKASLERPYLALFRARFEDVEFHADARSLHERRHRIRGAT